MKKAGFITGAVFLGVGAFVLFTFLTMWLWNWLMPAIFSLGIITFWQAAGLLLLSKILFSGHRCTGKWHSDRKKKYWRSRFEEKWHKIPEEKKEFFVNRMKEKMENSQKEKNQ